MSLFDWIGDYLHDKAMHTAHWNATRRLRARLAEEEQYLKQEEKARGVLLAPELPDPFDPTNVLPNSFVLLDNWDQDFSVLDFLQKRGGAIKDWKDPVTGDSAAALINRASQRHWIDPKLLLVSLQREKGIIRRKALPQKDMDWACGVGAWDKGKWAQRYRGFAKQIDKAAETYKNRFAGFQAGEEIEVDFGKAVVTPQNAGTYALYVYTPHTSAAKLTWLVWKGFFGV